MYKYANYIKTWMVYSVLTQAESGQSSESALLHQWFQWSPKMTQMPVTPCGLFVFFSTFLQVVFNADEASSSVKEVSCHSWKHYVFFECESSLWPHGCLCMFMSQCIEGVIGGTDYSQSKVNLWTASIVEHSLTHLVKQGRPFKYIGEPTSYITYINMRFLDFMLSSYVTDKHMSE